MSNIEKKPKLSINDISLIDNRIRSFIIENPDDECDEYYVKIWFSYKMGDDDVKPDGRQEFESQTKEILLQEIKDFMNSDKNGWCIV